MAGDIEVVIRSRSDNAGIVKTAKGLDGIKAQIRELSRQKINIGVDLDKAQAELRKLQAEWKAGTSGRLFFEIDADITAAKARIEELKTKTREIGRQKATLQVDASEAQAKISATNRALSSVDGKTSRANIDVNIGRALRNIAIVTAAIAAAGIAAAGIGIGAAGVAGIGAAFAGLSGVGDAVKALGDQTGKAGAAAKQAASNELQMAGAIDQVKSAQASLANTVRTTSDDQKRAAEGVRQAQEDLVQVQGKLTQSQQELTQARVDAARKLRDLQQQEEDVALAQRGATLDIAEAQQRLDAVIGDTRSTDLQRQQAQLAYDEAVQHNKELARQAEDLAKTKAEADRRGVSGSTEVVAAQKHVADAGRDVGDQQRRVAAAVTAAGEEQKQAAFQVAQAQQQVVSAQRAVQAASVAAGAAGVGAADKVADAMANLSPAAQSFARFLRGFIDGPIKDLRNATQAGLLPGLQAGLASLGPVIANNMPLISSFAKLLGQAFGGAIQAAGQLAPAFLKLANGAMQGLAPLQGVLSRFADAFGAMVDQMTKDGSLQAAMDGFVQLIEAVLQSLPQLLPPLIQLGVVLLPIVAKAFTLLADAVSAIIGWLGQRLPAATDAAGRGLKVVGAYVQEHVLPPLRELWRFIQVNIVPILQQLWHFITDDVVPALVSFARTVGEGLAEAFGIVSRAVGDHKQQLIELWNAFKDVVKFLVKDVIPIVGQAVRIAFLVVAVQIAAVIRVVALLVRAFNGMVVAAKAVAGAVRAIGSALTTAYNAVVGFGGRVLSFFGGLPRRLAGAAGNMWGWIKEGFRAAVNGLIDIWNSIHFPRMSITFPKVHIPGTNVDIGGGNFGFGPYYVPQIPHMASGGIVKARPGGTLALLGEGGRDEAVTPLGTGGQGESVHVVIDVVGGDGKITRAIRDAIQHAVRTQYGGSVQRWAGVT